MTITRTVELSNLTPKERAEFFAQIRPIASNWPNSGWCGQACSIISRLNPNGHYVLATLAGHLELSK